MYPPAVTKLKRTRTVDEYVRHVARLGGKARARKYGRRQLREWGKLGGRPRKAKTQTRQKRKAACWWPAEQGDLMSSEAPREYNRRYYLAHRSELLTNQREAYTANPEPSKERSRRHRSLNRERINADVRARRAAHPEEFRAREKRNRERNLAEYNRRQRERHRRRIPKVSAAEGALFRGDSKREEKLRIGDYVVCRACLGKLKRLTGGKWPHLGLVHKLTEKEYDANYPGAPLVCLALRRDLSKRGKQQMASARGRSRQRIKVRGHEAPARKWPIVRGLVQGHSYKQIGADVGRTVQTVKGTVDRLELAGRAALYDFGLPVTGATFLQIKAASGLSANELARQTQLPEPRMAEWVLPKYSAHRIGPESARKLIKWRDDTLRRLLADVSKPSRGLDRHSGSAVLKTFVPSLRQRYDLLLAALRHLRKTLKANSNWRATEIQDYLCEQAMLEVAGQSTGGPFPACLPLAAEMMPFIEASIDRLRGRGNLWPIAYEAIAARWGTTPPTVGAAIRPRTRTLRAREVRVLVRSASRDGPEQRVTASTRKKPGPKKLDYSQTEGFRVGKLVEDNLQRIEGLCGELRALPKRARTNADRAAALLSDKGYSRREIKAATNAPGTPLVAARWFVAGDTQHSYDTVAQYHKEFRAARPQAVTKLTPLRP